MSERPKTLMDFQSMKTERVSRFISAFDNNSCKSCKQEEE